jgi:hypothetical protein
MYALHCSAMDLNVLLERVIESGQRVDMASESPVASH